MQHAQIVIFRETGGKGLGQDAGLSEPLGGEEKDCLFLAFPHGAEGNGMAQGLVIAGTNEHGLKVAVGEHGGWVVRGVLAVHELGGTEYQKAFRTQVLFYGFTGTCLCLIGPGGKSPGVRDLFVTDRQMDACRGDKE